jgi:pimeloyl-ACP methyl ester carboxylesterase
MSILFAATYPERTAALVLLGGFARFTWAPDYPWGQNEEGLRAQGAPSRPSSTARRTRPSTRCAGSATSATISFGCSSAR